MAALGAGVLGEYAFAGPAVVGAGAVLGLLVAEAVVGVAKGGRRVAAVAAGALTGTGMVWAGWISTGHRLGIVGWEGWAAVAVGAAIAAFRARPPAAARRSRPAPAAAE